MGKKGKQDKQQAATENKPLDSPRQTANKQPVAMQSQSTPTKQDMRLALGAQTSEEGREALGLQDQPSEEPRMCNIIIVDLNSKEIPLKTAHYELLFELREFLSEHIYTCFFTNFFFEHNGQRLNDYTELSQLDLKTNPRIFMKPDKYDDQTARAHIKKLVDILEQPPALTMNVDSQNNLQEAAQDQKTTRRKSSLISDGATTPRSASKQAANAQEGEEETKESPAKEETLALTENEERMKKNYEKYHEVIQARQNDPIPAPKKLQECSSAEKACSEIKTLFKNPISQCDLNQLKHISCIESIQFSQFNPVSPKRRMAGDILYLVVRTLENPSQEHCITCSVNGFYKNDSTEKGMFYSNPSTRSNPCFSYTLAGCLHQLSPAFSRNLQEYLTSILKTEPYFFIKVPMPATPWIQQPSQSIKVSNADDLSQTVTPLFGYDPKQMRDWNEEYQVVSQFPAQDVMQRVQQERAIQKVYSDFLQAATAGAQAIIEGKLTSLNPNEPMKQHVYVYNQIFFSYAIDLPTSYRDLTSSDSFPSYTQANHDLAGLKQLQALTDVQDLFNLATCLVSVKSLYGALIIKFLVGKNFYIFSNMVQQRIQISNNFGSKFSKIDSFGEQFKWKLPGGDDVYRTRLGALFSIIIAIVLIFYGSLQMQRLAMYGETVVTMSIRDSYFSPEDVFPDDLSELTFSNFNVAFGFAAYDGNTEPIVDPSYGLVKTKYVAWGFGESLQEQVLSTHPCTPEELGITQENDAQPQFYKIANKSYNDTVTYQKVLNCIDEPVNIQGDYNSYKGRVLKFYFDKCNNDTFVDGVCKSEQEIKSYLRRKFIVTLHNQVRFNTMDYSEERMVRESVLTWYPVDSQLRQEHVVQVQVTELQLQDVIHIQLGQFTEIEGQIFGVKQISMRPYEYFDDVHMAVSIELDLNLYRIDREAYNLLDWLGDIGGLLEALTIIFTFILLIFNYQSFQDYMVTHLFREETKRDRVARMSNTLDDDQSLYLQKFEGHTLDKSKVNCLFKRINDSSFLCCYKRRDKHYRLFERGRKKLQGEIEIVNVIQGLRLLKKHVDLKIKLNYDEKRYVENNRFTKLTLTDPSDSNSGKDQKSNEKTLKHATLQKKQLSHQKEAAKIFKRRPIRDAYHNRSASERAKSVNGLMTLTDNGFLEHNSIQDSIEQRDGQISFHDRHAKVHSMRNTEIQQMTQMVNDWQDIGQETKFKIVSPGVLRSQRAFKDQDRLNIGQLTIKSLDVSGNDIPKE